MKPDLEINKGFKLHYASKRGEPERASERALVQGFQDPQFHLRRIAWPLLHVSLSFRELRMHHMGTSVFASAKRKKGGSVI